MARPLRIEYPGVVYHVIKHGLSRRNSFMEDKGRQSFLDLLFDITGLWKVEIYACGLEKTSSVRSAYLRMKARVTEESCFVENFV